MMPVYLLVLKLEFAAARYQIQVQRHPPMLSDSTSTTSGSIRFTHSGISVNLELRLYSIASRHIDTISLQRHPMQAAPRTSTQYACKYIRIKRTNCCAYMQLL